MINIIWNSNGQQTADITDVTQSTCYRLIEDTYPLGAAIIDCSTPLPEGIEDIVVDPNAPRKILIDNVIFILRGDHIYTIQGQEVK